MSANEYFFAKNSKSFGEPTKIHLQNMIKQTNTPEPSRTDRQIQNFRFAMYVFKCSLWIWVIIKRHIMVDDPKYKSIAKLTIRDYLVFAIIMTFVSTVYITTNFYFEEDNAETVTFLVPTLGALSVFVLCMIVAREQKFVRRIDRSFIFLGVSFMSITLGEITYWLLDVNGLETYPSIADVFFFLQYPMLMVFHMKMVQVLVPKQRRPKFIAITAAVPSVLILAYMLMTIPHTAEFGLDFWYGSVFIAATSSTLGMTASVVITTRGGMINKIWSIIFLGLMLNAVGDVWYYTLEYTESYELLHPVNLFWYASYAIMIYAVYKQKRIFSGIINKDI